MTPREQIVWAVLEMAKSNNDETVIGACRRCIRAETIGWRKHGNPADYRFIREIYEGMKA